MGIGIETSLTTSILAYFVIASAFILWKRQSSQKPKGIDQQTSRDDDGENSQCESSDAPDRDGGRTKPFRLKRTLLVVVFFVTVVTISEAAVRGLRLGGFMKDAHDDILADLLFGFSWTVLFLSLNGSQRVTFAHQGACILSFLLSTSFMVKSLLYRPVQFGSRGLRDMITVFRGCRIFLVGLTCVFVFISAWLPPLSVDTDPETEPLLAEARTQQNEQTKTKDKTDEDKARDEIRNRPGMEYLKSFYVFIPFMWPVTKRQKAHVAGMILCSALQRVTAILQPLVLGMVVNNMAETWSVPWKSISIYIFVGIIDSRIGLPMLEDALYMYLQTEQELALKRAAYDHILNLSADFHDSKTSSYVWSAMYQACSTIGLIHDIAFSIGPSIIDLIAGFVVLYALFGDYMGLLILATIVLFLWLTANAISPRADLYRKHADCWYNEYLQTLDSTQNWYTVSEFNQIPYEKEQFRTRGQAIQDINIAIWWYNEISSAVRYSVMTLAFAAACCLAAVQIARHEQKVGAFVTLTSYWAQLTAPLSQLVGEINNASEKLVRAEKLLVLLEKKPKVQDNETAEPFKFLGGEVEFDNVYFSYDGTRQASEGISFRAPAGSTTALVGETGGGKSTILKLLFRFHDPQQGRVLIDGQDVRKLQLRSFRKHIGWVPQDAVPFNKTVLDNVRYSDLDLDTDRVEQACMDAAFHDKIMTFTKKYQETVGERGIKLSGGERQRLAIARAILKAPDILLLDEATSAVDSTTEAQIQLSLEKLGKLKTTFVIAHRLSTILKADQILVIEKGKLVEHGNHNELIKLNGAYKKLWDSQLKLQQAGITGVKTEEGEEQQQQQQL